MCAHGERNGKAKLTDAQVAAIRADYVPHKHGYKRTAKKHGIPESTAYCLINELRRPSFAA